MDFNSFLKRKISDIGTKAGSFGSLTTASAKNQLQNISLFKSASLDQIKSIDLDKLLQSETIDGAIDENATSDQKALAEIVKALMDIDDIKEIADADGDGTITGDEAIGYFQGIMGNDGDAATLSMNDIDKEISSLGIDLEKIVEDAIKDTIEEKELEKEKIEEEKAAPQTSGSSSAGGGGSISNGGSSNYSPSTSSVTKNNAKQGESASDIEQQIQEEESKKDEIKSKMDSDIAEQEKVISEAMNDKESGFPEGFEEEYNKEKAAIDEEITAKDTEIETQKGVVQDKTATISALGDSISSLESQKGTLSSQLGSVSSDAEDAESQKADIQAKIDNVQAEIDSKTKEKEQAENDKKEAETNLEKAQQEKTELTSKRDNLLDTMTKEKGLTINPETQEKIKDAQSKISEIRNNAETEVNACDTKIQELKTKLEEIKEKEDTDKTISENSVYDGNIPSELASAIDAKCGAGFAAKVEEIAKKLNCDPNDLLGMMYSESGLNSKAVNGSSGATGLIQFMPSTAQGLGTSTSALANMSPIDQLDWVEKYYDANKKAAGIPDGQRLEAGQLYALVFLPAYANKEVLTVSGHKYYNANSGLDTDKNGDISISDLTTRVQNKYKELYSAWT